MTINPINPINLWYYSKPTIYMDSVSRKTFIQRANPSHRQSPGWTNEAISFYETVLGVLPMASIATLNNQRVTIIKYYKQLYIIYIYIYTSMGDITKLVYNSNNYGLKVI